LTFAKITAVKKSQIDFCVDSTVEHLQSISDFIVVLAALMGFGLGFGVIKMLGAELEALTPIIQALLFNKLASFLVLGVFAMRLVISHIQVKNVQFSMNMGPRLVACVLTANLGVGLFLCVALLAYVAGAELSQTQSGFGWDAINYLGDQAQFSFLPRMLMKVSIQALVLAWLSHFLDHWDRSFNEGEKTENSRTATRLLMLMVLTLVVIETLDAYLSWIWTL
jgi:hypothetical protein